jgi:hypothetical protein
LFLGLREENILKENNSHFMISSLRSFQLCGQKLKFENYEMPVILTILIKVLLKVEISVTFNGDGNRSSRVRRDIVIVGKSCEANR